MGEGIDLCDRNSVCPGQAAGCTAAAWPSSISLSSDRERHGQRSLAHREARKGKSETDDFDLRAKRRPGQGRMGCRQTNWCVKRAAADKLPGPKHCSAFPQTNLESADARLDFRGHSGRDAASARTRDRSRSFRHDA